MKVQAVINFDDHGRERKAGEVWEMVCKECALKLIRAGKVKKA